MRLPCVLLLRFFTVSVLFGLTAAMPSFADDAPVNSLRGIVTDLAGKPIAGARVEASHWASQNRNDTTTEATTDASGRYVIEGLGSGKYSVRANAKGFGEIDPRWNLVFDGKTKTIQVSPFKLPRMDSFVGGVIFDLQNKPIAGATLLNRATNTTATTDARGHFHFDGVCKRDITMTVNDPRSATPTAVYVYALGGREDNRIRLLTEAEKKADNERFFAQRLAADNHGDGTPAPKLLYDALTAASKTKRAVFLTFHASWCGPCFILHEYLRKPAVKPIIDKYFVVQDIDMLEREHTAWNNPGGEALYRRYAHMPNERLGVPFWIVLGSDGKPCRTQTDLGKSNMGYPVTFEGYDYFLKTLKTAAPGLTDSEMEILRQELAYGFR